MTNAKMFMFGVMSASVLLELLNIWLMDSFTTAIILGVIFSINAAVYFQDYGEEWIETVGFALAFALVFAIVSGVLLIGRGVYVDLHVTKTILDFQTTREVTFADDSKSIHYKTGATETVFSKVYETNEAYLQNKSNFLQNSDSSCKIFSKNLKYANIVDKNVTEFECD